MTLREMAEEHAQVKFEGLNPMGNPMYSSESYGALMSREVKITAFEAGFRASQTLVIEYLNDYRRAYSEDLCPPRKLEEFDPMVRTVVAFHMGRFLLDNMMRAIPGLAEPITIAEPPPGACL
jgi:hypothetical protein